MISCNRYPLFKWAFVLRSRRCHQVLIMQHMLFQLKLSYSKLGNFMKTFCLGILRRLAVLPDLLQVTTAAWRPGSSCTAASGSTWSRATCPPSSSWSCPGSASGWMLSTSQWVPLNSPGLQSPGLYSSPGLIIASHLFQGRVALGVTTLLTISSKSAGLSSETPQVSYVKVKEN